MNRLTKRLSNLKNNNKKALVGYLVAGDPDIDTTIELMKLFTSSGVDIIEIGVPFTDPIAEGPIIQKAHDRALKKGISLESIFKMIEKYRQFDNETPLVLMGYLNTFIFHKSFLVTPFFFSASRYSAKIILTSSTIKLFMSATDLES